MYRLTGRHERRARPRIRRSRRPSWPCVRAERAGPLDAVECADVTNNPTDGVDPISTLDPQPDTYRVEYACGGGVIEPVFTSTATHCHIGCLKALTAGEALIASPFLRFCF